MHLYKHLLVNNKSQRPQWNQHFFVKVKAHQHQPASTHIIQLTCTLVVHVHVKAWYKYTLKRRNLRKSSGRALQCFMLLTLSHCLMCCVHDLSLFWLSFVLHKVHKQVAEVCFLTQWLYISVPLLSLSGAETAKWPVLCFLSSVIPKVISKTQCKMSLSSFQFCENNYVCRE